MTKYVVVENDMGYLPDSEPEVYDTLEEAQQRLKDIREEWLEDGASPFTITGSYKDGYYILDGGRIAEIMEFTDEESEPW